MLRAFLLIYAWLKMLNIDPAGVRITVRFGSMRDRIIAAEELKANASLPLTDRDLKGGFAGTIYGIPFSLTDPTHD